MTEDAETNWVSPTLGAKEIRIFSPLDAVYVINVGLSLHEIAQGRRIVVPQGPDSGEGTTVYCGFFSDEDFDPSVMWQTIDSDFQKKGSVCILLGIPPPDPARLPKPIPDDACAVYIPDKTKPASRDLREELLERGISTFPARDAWECFVAPGGHGYDQWVRAARNIDRSDEIPFPEDAKLSLGILHCLSQSLPDLQRMSTMVCQIAKLEAERFIADGDEILRHRPGPAGKFTFRKGVNASDALGLIGHFPRILEPYLSRNPLTSFLFTPATEGYDMPSAV